MALSATDPPPDIAPSDTRAALGSPDMCEFVPTGSGMITQSQPDRVFAPGTPIRPLARPPCRRMSIASGQDLLRIGASLSQIRPRTHPAAILESACPYAFTLSRIAVGGIVHVQLDKGVRSLHPLRLLVPISCCRIGAFATREPPMFGPGRSPADAEVSGVKLGRMWLASSSSRLGGDLREASWCCPFSWDHAVPNHQQCCKRPRALLVASKGKAR